MTFATASTERQSRQQFLRSAARFGLSAAGAAFVGGCANLSLSSPTNGSLETTKVRLTRSPSICQAPAYLAEDILKNDGFSDVQYVNSTAALSGKLIADGEADFGLQFSGPLIAWIDAQQPVTILAGVHIGCFELFGGSQLHTILDLKGKSVAILSFGSTDHIFLSIMATYVGLDPRKDINWVPLPADIAKQQFIAGKVDAFLAFPPVAQELVAVNRAPVIVNSMMDKPWSQYYCCMIAGNPDFVRKNPIATKRVVSAILKATDTCALDPERAARFIVDRGYADNYDYALTMMKEIPYNRWREYDPADTLRFYSLRLHEAGMINGSPDQIIAKAADWRFLDQIKKETLTASFNSASYRCRPVT